MSSDGNLKLAHIPYRPIAGEASATTHKRDQHQEPVCAFCEHAILRRHHPVLLKSGKSVHLHCYLQMPKRHGNRGRNSK